MLELLVFFFLFGFDSTLQQPGQDGNPRANLTNYMLIHITSRAVNGRMDFPKLNEIVRNSKQKEFGLNILRAKMSSDEYLVDFKVVPRYFDGYAIGYQSERISVTGIECIYARKAHAINKTLPDPWDKIELDRPYTFLEAERENCLWEIEHEEDITMKFRVIKYLGEICDDNLYPPVSVESSKRKRRARLT